MQGSRNFRHLPIVLLTLAVTACGGGGGGGDDGGANRAPTASMTANPTSGSAPLQVAMDASASSDADGSITAYDWAFGDGESGSGVTSSHTYTSAGTYTATLTVTDNGGTTASTSTTITVSGGTNQAPTASMTANPTSGSAPLQVAMDASASSDADGSITAYDWTFGDGESGSGVTTSHTYTSAGTYTATLTVTDNGGTTASTSTTITVTGGTNGYSLSGTITSADNITVDSDLNDPLADYATNDQASSAQEVGNPIMINGFVSNEGTGVNGDRFADSADSIDTYRTSLYAGQYVSLRVASFDADVPENNDVDVQLYDNDLNLIAESQTTTEFESIAVPSDGQYYIQVLAYSGVNKYVLSIGSTSLGSARAASGWSADFALDQAIVKRRPQTVGARSVTPLTQLRGVQLSHISTDRLALAHLESGRSLSELFPALKSKTSIPAQDSWSQNLSEETRKKIATLALIKQLNLRPDIDSASPNFILHAMLEPNDTHYGYQEHYRQIRLPQAWDITTGTPDTGEIIVAVVDTGIANDHEDFDGQLVDGYDFISNAQNSNDGDGIDNDPYDPGTSTVPGESVFHGTHVAGTIAAASNNNLGAAGIAWGAKIMPVRVLGLGGRGDLYDILQGVRYAAGLSNDSNTLPARAADIINLSLGGSGFTQEAQDTYNEVRDAGVIVIAAAGNDNTSTLAYPASYDGVISVSAMDWQNDKAPYSNFGTAVDVAAPGGNLKEDVNGDGYGDGVLSCVINDSSGQRVSNYAFFNGTSMASPHMAGVVALMKAVYPDLTPAKLDNMLSDGLLTNDLGATGRDDIYGYGMIDAFKAVKAAQDAAGQPTTNTVTASPTSIDFGTALQTATITLSGQGSSPPSVTSVNKGSTWLSVTTGSVDANGLGEYNLSVDRSGLVDAVYTDTVEFSLSDGTTLRVSITLRIQSQPTGDSGNAGFLYMVLFDETLNNQGQLELSPTNGSYQFQFQNVAAGDYYLIAGSDVDNDGKICEVGESCGAYPVRTQEVLVTVDQDISGLDFIATINSGLSGAASTNFALPTEGIVIKKPVIIQK